MVVATFGEFDEDAVEAGIRLGLPYVGLVASARRAGQVLSGLRERGLQEAELAVVRSPAGLQLGTNGQEGISLSVMAEISSLRAAALPSTQPAAHGDIVSPRAPSTSPATVPMPLP